MPLLKGERFVEDLWTHVADEAPLPVEAPVIVSTARLEAEAEALRSSWLRLGVRVLPDYRIEDLAPWLDRLDLVALAFPTFGDGRAFSAAAMLRGQMGFRGEVRAVGQVRVDQHPFMRRVGFDAFEIEDDPRVLRSWAEARIAIDLAYQTDDPGQGPLPVWQARRRQARAAA